MAGSASCLAALVVFCFFFDFGFTQLAGLADYAETCFETSALCFISAESGSTFGCGICSQDQVRFAPFRLVAQLTELEEFLNSSVDEQEILVISTELYVSEQALELIRSQSQNVLAVYVEQESNPSDVSFPNDQGFSPALTSPNNVFSSDPMIETSWNPTGNGLRASLFSVPMYALPSAVIQDLLRNSTRLQAFGEEFPRAEMKPGGVMWACGQDAGTCLQQGTCQPVGGHSVWVAGERVNSEDVQTKELVAVSSMLDSTSFFPELGHGAWDVTGAAALIAAADAFATYKREVASTTPVIRIPIFFGFFGESFGYAGSDRFLVDVQEFTCTQQADFSEGQGYGCVSPYAPSTRFLNFRDANWNSHIHMGPVGPGADANLYGHTDGKQEDINTALKQVLQSNYGEGLVFDEEFDAEAGLPPSSSNSFVSRLPEVPSVTLTNYQESFDFEFYQSMFDNTVNSLDSICSAAEGLAKSVIQLAYDEQPDASTVNVNCTLVEEVFRCFTSAELSDCKIAAEYMPQSWLQSILDFNEEIQVSQSYPSVFTPLPVTQEQAATRLFRQSLMRYFLGYINAEERTETTCNSDSDCNKIMEDLNANVADNSQAFGTGIQPNDSGLNTFRTNNNGGAAFTESVWGSNLDSVVGYCLQAVDSYDYGVSIVIAGVFVWVGSAMVLFAASFFLRGKIVDDNEQIGYSPA